MNIDNILEVIVEHKGKVIGISLGLLFGLLTVLIGFWKTFFVSLCIVIGYIIGKKIDDNDRVREIINRFIDKRFK